MFNGAFAGWRWGWGHGPGQHIDEAALAQTAHPNQRTSYTIFEKIIRRESPATIIYEDELCIAFYDIRPQAPVHFLVVPKKPIPSLSASNDWDEMLLGRLMVVARRLASQLRLSRGYRIIVNNGPHACQTVYHLHLHVVGGRQLRWPPC